MNTLKIALTLYVAAILALVGALLIPKIGAPGYLSTVLWFTGGGMMIIGLVLQRRRAREAQIDIAPRIRLRNLALWVVIAFLLVFLFNLFQGNGGHSNPASDPAPNHMPDLMSVLISWAPMFVVLGVWIFYLRLMYWKRSREKNSDKPHDS